MTVYLPTDPRPKAWEIGDILMVQHGPVFSNIFIWEITGVRPITQRYISDSEEYEKYRGDIDRYVKQEMEED